MNAFRRAGVVAALALLSPALAPAQTIDASRGVDPAVDYEALKRFGPWSDQNYRLTAADLSLLAVNEAELKVAVPAFFRVALRRRWPDLPRDGQVQYPDSALPLFFARHDGYRVNGRYYRGAQRLADGRWRVHLEHPVARLNAAGDLLWLRGEGEVRVTNPGDAAESSIEANPVNPNVLVAGSNGPGTGQQMHYSFDGGSTWNAAAALPLGGACCDPTIAWSSDGRFAYTASLGGGPIYFYRSADEGMTWEDLASENGDPRREIDAGGFADKEFLHVDHSPASPYRDNIYLSWQESNIQRFARSTDFGNTFDPVISFSADAESRGIGSDIATDRAGTIYYVWPASVSSAVRLRRSTDGGQTFGTESVIAAREAPVRFALPSMEQRQVLVTATAVADISEGDFADSVYVAWTDTAALADTDPAQNHARIQVAFSRDGGDTWRVRTPHPTGDVLEVDRWNQGLAVAPDGTVHLTYYNTLGDPSRTSVNLFHTFSLDGGETWSPEQPLTTERSPNIENSFEFGDYNGLAATLDRVVAVFTDNRSEDGGTGDSVDIYAALKPRVGDDPAGFTLSDAEPGVAGKENRWTTSNGPPNAVSLLMFARAEGATAVAIGPCEVTIGLQQSRPFAFAFADNEGIAQLLRSIPAQLAGTTLYFQALSLPSCDLSNVTTSTF